jgi:outer membrane protein OmpA-like peptidoglycan-associated protein
MFKKTLFITIALLFFTQVNGQFLQSLKEKVKEKATERAEQKIDTGIDKTLDGAENAASGTSETTDEEGEVIINNKAGTHDQQDFKTYSKYDFIPGEEVIFYDDFSDVPIGEFPLQWNTTSSGDIVTTSTFPGKWFNMPGDYAFYSPELFLPYPDNFTIEFDLISKDEFDFWIDFYENNTKYLDLGYYPGEGGFQLGFTAEEVRLLNYDNGENGDVREIGNGTHPYLESNQKIRYSIWGQKQRLRVYINGTKAIDVPRAIPRQFSTNYMRFGIIQPIMISGFRFAVGRPDTRSRLLTEGKLVTRGITFDTGSEKIKPESFGVLKEIADVLTENNDVRIKIIGHTDSDGADEMNLVLSKKRSAAVKIYLEQQFGIGASRVETDGMGESEPISPNDAPEGKANNRRVEFIKIT